MSSLWYSWVSSTSKSSNSVRDTQDIGFLRHPHQNDCKTSMIMVRIPVNPSKFGIISNTFLVETWFFYLLGEYFKHLLRFQDLLMQFYLLTPSLVIKWILEFFSNVFISQLFNLSLNFIHLSTITTHLP